ncbi:methyl-accepting chemotaxis protein [Atopomonas hussainii]|uniref:Methyl-accepting chemotaxis protein n=1 Tax=Atopomonas hussainii TaxID=1429083 RepID=A0A1H7SAA3_9GAMM|nr:type IV pili methyl-accepting chemotaxis transducer N-terminal domain-containing protein [Atopomonas hussainii]SEL69423.1 methyl-accepting chemotaxis protein [Atopomonas hussainii]
MTDAISHSIQRLLRALGLRSINAQFFFSYCLIFCCAALTAAVLFFSEQDASQIDRAGAQRMLSQKVTKEALLVAQGVLPMAELEASISRFNEAQRLLIEGDARQGIAPISHPKAQQDLARVARLWQDVSADALQIASGKALDLAAFNQASLEVLKQMHQIVGELSADANATAQQQLWLALGSTVLILILVVLGRVAGMGWLMNRISQLRECLEKVAEGDFSRALNTPYNDD